MSVRLNVHMSEIMRTLIKVGVRSYAMYANFQTLQDIYNIVSRPNNEIKFVLLNVPQASKR